MDAARPLICAREIVLRSHGRSTKTRTKNERTKSAALLLGADDERLGAAIAACAGRSGDMQGAAVEAIGAHHGLVRAARSPFRLPDDPEARAGPRRPLGSGLSGWSLSPGGAGRAGWAGRTLRPLRPGGALVALLSLAQPETAISAARVTPATNMRIGFLDGRRDKRRLARGNPDGANGRGSRKSGGAPLRGPVTRSTLLLWRPPAL